MMPGPPPPPPPQQQPPPAQQYREPPRHVLVLDTSKSMLAPITGVPKRKIEVAREAVGKILEEVKAQQAYFGIVVFNSTARVLFPISQKIPTLEAVVRNTVPTGRSAIWDAIGLGADQLRSPTGEIVGNLVLVTDGWDNMSRYFRLGPQAPESAMQQGSRDIVEYIMRPGTQLKLQIIGIGSGAEKDRGVDSALMQILVNSYTRKATEFATGSTVTYMEVLTGEDLYRKMVNAFLDVPFEDTEAFGALSNEDLAKHAAGVASALRDTSGHTLVDHLGAARKSDAPAGNDAAFDVTVSVDGNIPQDLRQRYGPIGDVATAFMAGDWAAAQAILMKNAPIIHPVTRAYWLARIGYARGDQAEAARHLTDAWIEANGLRPSERAVIYRRLALLHAKISGDMEVQSLVQIFERAILAVPPDQATLKNNLEAMFEKILDLRRTYASIKSGGAVEHEKLVEEIFGLLQDARIEDKARDPNIQSFLSLAEVALSEMR